MRRIVDDLDVEDGRKPAQPLRADAQRIDLVEYLDPQRLNVGLRPAQLQRTHVDRVHQRLFRQQHAMFRRAADADAQHARGTPARAHLRDHFEHPVDDRVAGVHHLELGLVLAAATLGRDIDRHRRSRHQLDMQHAGRVIPGVTAGKGGIGQYRGAQLVFGVEIGTADAFIDHLLHRLRCVVETAVHAPFDEDIDDAGILADRTMPFGAHAAVRQDLRDRVLGRGRLFGRIGFAERADIVHRVIIADELERVGDAFDKISLLDRNGHGPIPPDYLRLFFRRAIRDWRGLSRWA